MPFDLSERANGSHAPDVTVALCTRNRPDQLAECVRSILANQGSRFELVVIDQSLYENRSDSSQEMADPRVRYFPSTSRGLSHARNEALELARGKLVAFTDDDCLVPVDWLERIERFFAASPGLALAFGRVIAPVDLAARGFLPGFEPEDVSYCGTFPSPMKQWGMGANMVLRFSMVEQVGPFDPCLGAGAVVPAGEEFDLEMRALGAGLLVAHTSEFELTHLGLRGHEASRELLRGYALGTGAAYAKNMRLRTPGSAVLFSRWMLSQTGTIIERVLRKERPLGLGRAFDTLRGWAGGMTLPLDQTQRSFVSSSSSAPPQSTSAPSIPPPSTLPLG